MQRCDTKGRNADKAKALVQQANIEVLDVDVTNGKSVSDAIATIIKRPKKILARSEDKLQSLFVKNGEFVNEQQPLAYLQSTGNHDQVFALRKWMGVVELIEHNNIKNKLSIPIVSQRK